LGVAVRFDAGLAGIGAAMLVAYTTYYLALLAVSVWPELASHDRIRYLTIHAAALIPVIAAAGWAIG
jgi:hypothetical protein